MSEKLLALLDHIETLAFKLEPPNPITPQIVQATIEARRLLNTPTPTTPSEELREAVARIVWNRFGEPHQLEFPGAIHEWGSVADAILARLQVQHG